MPIGYRTIDDIDLNELWYGGGGIVPAVDQYQEIDVPIIESLMMPHGGNIMKYGISERNGFQPLGPGERPDRKYVQMATIYPTWRKYGYAVGTDIDTLLMSTGAEIRLDLERPFKEDRELLFTEMVRRMMIDPGVLNVNFGWYNGAFAVEEAIVAPPNYMQRTFAASHTHYLHSIAATVTIPDITAMKQTIREHGHGGQLVGFINSSMRMQLENLAQFTSSSLIVRSPVSDMVAVMGFPDVFDLLGVQFYVTEVMPDNYILMVVANADAGGRPVIFFEPPNIRGLQVWPGNNAAYPLIESTVSRTFGMKVLRRGAGASMLVAAGGVGAAYVNPTLI